MAFADNQFLVKVSFILSLTLLIVPQVNAGDGINIGQIRQAILELPLTNEEQVNFVRIRPPESQQIAANDYFDIVMKESKGKIIRFQSMPISVFIAPYKEKSFIDSCVAGFEDWEGRSQGLVRFTQVNIQDKARIKVIWSHLGINTAIGACTLGAHTVTRWQYRNLDESGQIKGSSLMANRDNSQYDVSPQIIEVNLDLIYSKPDDIRMRLLRNIIAHELGHALGILGHSPVQADLMNNITDECSRLSERDINTLIKLYRSPPDVSL